MNIRIRPNSLVSCLAAFPKGLLDHILLTAFTLIFSTCWEFFMLHCFPQQSPLDGIVLLMFLESEQVTWITITCVCSLICLQQLSLTKACLLYFRSNSGFNIGICSRLTDMSTAPLPYSQPLKHCRICHLNDQQNVDLPFHSTSFTPSPWCPKSASANSSRSSSSSSCCLWTSAKKSKQN